MDLYYIPLSSPCRAVIMTAEALGIELNKKLLDLFAGEHLKPDYLKLNPQHTVPTLVDNDFSLWESRAIIIYMAEKYGNNNPLYPDDPQQRAIINQRLFFDAGTLYQSFLDTYVARHILKHSVDSAKYKKIETAFEFLNIFLGGQNYVAGDAFTLADISLLATVASFDVCNHDFSKYTNVTRWYENLKKTAPGWEENWAGCLELKKFMNHLEALQYSNEIIELPAYPCHSQNTERFVHTVHESAMALTDEQRMGQILSKLKSRQKYSQLES